MSEPKTKQLVETLLDYEIRGSVWVPLISLVSNARVQCWIATWFAWKVNRKMRRMRRWKSAKVEEEWVWN